MFLFHDCPVCATPGGGRRADPNQNPLVRGRLFTAGDSRTAPPVAIVDQELAKRFWPDRDPIGQRIAVGAVANSNPPVPLWRTVVGVVGHVKNNTLDQQGREQSYFPLDQTGFRIASMYVTLRATGDPVVLASTVRREVHALDAALPVYEEQMMMRCLANRYRGGASICFSWSRSAVWRSSWPASARTASLRTR